MAGDRPSGTVTFLFTDIEGSTRLWEQQPDEMREALALHDGVVRSAIEENGGYVFATGGDGFCAAFWTAGEAIAAAVEAQSRLSAQEWPGDLVVRARMGAHTGSGDERGGDYFGRAPTSAARVMAAGHGGQILVTAATAELLSGVELTDLGIRRLRDLSTPRRLFQVDSPDGQAVFPALRTLDLVPGNLKRQATAFVGRRDQLDALTEAVMAHRLVTLTGVGGVGKTRLSCQVAAELVPEFPDGVWQVELAGIGDPQTVPDVVASTLGLAGDMSLPVLERVAAALAGQRLLLVLDNCEHLLDAVAELAEAILSVTDSVRLIATSREGLGVLAEHLWPVPSMSLGAGEASEAVALFVDRALAVDPAFDSASHVEEIEEICERLDGIALAIELAAARMVSMTPGEVRDRLDQRFRLLSGRRRGLERHQTLRHAVQWSYDLLEADEAEVLRRCAVFSGGFDLAAATALAAAGVEGSDEYVILDLLDALVRKSLLLADDAGEVTRYSMLETVRQFAEDKLAEGGHIETCTDQHAEYYASAAEVMLDRWWGPEQVSTIEWLEIEIGNIRSAFSWSTEQENLDIAASLATSAHYMGFFAQQLEPIGWSEALLPAAKSADHPKLLMLLLSGSLSAFVGRTDEGRGHADEALKLLDDERYERPPDAMPRVPIGNSHMMAGQPEEFVRLCQDEVDIGGDPSGFARAAVVWGLCALGRHDEARERIPRLLDRADSSRVPAAQAFARDAIALAIAPVDPQAALELDHEALQLAQESGLRVFQSFMYRNVAALEAEHGDLQTACETLNDGLRICHRGGNIPNLLATLGFVAILLERVGELETAATIAAAAASESTPGLVPQLDGLVSALKQALGSDHFEKHTEAGRAMEPAGAVALAQAKLSRLQPTTEGS